MWVVQRKADGRYLQRREGGIEVFTLNKHEAKQYTSAGRAMNGMLEAMAQQCNVDRGFFNRRAAKDLVEHFFQIRSILR